MCLINKYNFLIWRDGCGKESYFCDKIFKNLTS